VGGLRLGDIVLSFSDLPQDGFHKRAEEKENGAVRPPTSPNDPANVQRFWI